MRKQFLVITILAVSLLFTQGGGFLVASLCPHLQSAMSSCVTPLIATAMAHGNMETMEHNEMGSMEHAPAIDQGTDAMAFGPPTSTCAHCSVHSRTTIPTVSLRESEASRRLADATLPLRFSSASLVPTPPVRRPVSRAHGPPGSNIARYVLINTFRI